jgi:LPXTG-site transpeptidase (sortase) family protein
MRMLVSSVGAALVLFSLAGALALVLEPSGPAPVPVVSELQARAEAQHEAASAPAPGATPDRPITRLKIDSIGLDTPVLPAPLTDRDGATTWDVPPMVAGHAEGTPGAGQPGNAIVMGHLTSIHLGNVFLHLDAVKPGDVVEVFSHDQRFTYRATEVHDVDRMDLGVLEPTEQPSLTLITCSGAWLPTVWDYAQRLVVRAELAG